MATLAVIGWIWGAVATWLMLKEKRAHEQTFGFALREQQNARTLAAKVASLEKLRAETRASLPKKR